MPPKDDSSAVGSGDAGNKAATGRGMVKAASWSDFAFCATLCSTDTDTWIRHFFKKFDTQIRFNFFFKINNNILLIKIKKHPAIQYNTPPSSSSAFQITHSIIQQ